MAVYPASRGQQRMWFLQHYAPESPVYSSPSAFHLVGPLNVAWLEAAFDAVIQRHDMLRTTFAMENDGLFQRVAAASAFQLQQVSLEGTPADARKAAAERCLDTEACRPFDLTAGPPFRTVLVRLQPTEHVLLLVLHHIISDGWSRSIFYRELSAAYEALATRRPTTMRELPVQFADYSAWQNEWLEDGALEAQTTYWKTKLAGEPEPLDLPSDHARPATESFRGGRCARRLDAGLTAALKTRAQEEGATLFMILLAAFKTLLHRYTGQDDLIVGVPIANRPRVEVEGLIGFFANTLVLRTTFPDDLTFRELLRRVKETAVEAYANQDMPFERLVQLLRVRRDAGRTPLFQTTFAIQDFPAVVFELPEIQTAPWFVSTHTAKFDFSLTLERSAAGWTAAVEYSTDLFEANRVERMLDHWCVILEGIAANPAQRVPEMPLFTAAEQRQILVEWKQTEPEHPQDEGIHQLFEEQVERTPEAVAVVSEGKSLTYRELNTRADHLAHHLRRLGVGPEALVGICVEWSPDMAVAMMAVFKAGGALVPIEPDLPKERIEFIMADTQMPWLLTQSSLLDKFPPTAARKIFLDKELASIPDNGPGAASQPEVTPQNLAYILYTSGSTGRPKGVLMTQEAYLSYCGAAIEYFRLQASDRVLQLAPFSFDAGLDQLLTPLLAGATVVMRGAELWDPACFTDIIKERGLTVVHLTPGYWQTWVETLSNETIGESVGALRLVQVGGDVMPMATVRRWRELKLRSVRLVNRYGPTETTMFSTACEVPAEQPADDRVERIPIGRPVGRRTIHILDAQGKPVPIGVAGEIHIGGDTLARGYLNRPELSAERFILDPFSGKPGARLYKTGDVGRRLPDGQFEFLGRADFQVKIRGYRIELEEIEAVLVEHPNVQSAVTVAHEDPSGERCLVAYVVPREQPLPFASELRRHLSAKLPDYMVPAKFIGLAALPRTPNGKVDRRSLPPPNRQTTEDARDVLSLSEPAPVSATLTPEERHRLLFEWNQTAKNYPQDQCVHQLFEQQVRRTPDAKAVMFEGNSLTYGELNARANRVAHHLRSLGVGPETLVGICVERSPDMIIGLLAVLKAGGAFVPMTSDLPVARLAFQMEDARLAVLLTQEPLLARLPPTGARIVCLDRLPASAEAASADNPQPGVTLENLAYVIYTSGSTGQPKGVLIPHEALLCYCFSAMEWWRLEASDRVLHFFTFSFDVSIDQILSPLLAGAAVFIRGTERWEPAQLTEAIEEHGLTVAGLPPAYWQQWVESLDRRAVSELLASLRLVVLGGDAVPIGPVARWQEVAGASIRLVNAYGPTEATVFATAYEIPLQWPDEVTPKRVPIGRPLSNRTAYVLDPQGNPVPVGVVGELYLGGEGLARGYLHQPELTAERFVPDPFSGKPGARLYRTGDLARFLPDGDLDLSGRTDFQVKIRGFRIELGEIEAVLGGHPEVAACAVVAQERGGGEKVLAAFVVGREQASPSVESLRLWLMEKLPDYMIPSRFVAVAALPLNPNGKVDRKALGKLDGEELASGIAYVSPRNELEIELVQIWQAVLNRERVGVHENFFDLGGHSLLAVVICSQINRRLGKAVPMRWVFEHPTVEALAGRLESLENHPRDLRPMEKAARQQPLLMSFAQQRMWLVQQTLPDPATYNQPMAWRLSGRVDRERVRRALQVIVGRHEILRTALVQAGESLVQRVAEAHEIPLPWQEMDLQAVPPDEQQSVLEKRLLEEACRPFDLAQAPLWRCVWVELAEDEQVLAFTFHHSIVDEWTWRLFFQELERLYATDGRLELAGLPELPVQYADYAAWQRQRLTGELLEQQRVYWKEQLRDLPPALELPTDLARSVRRSGRGAVHGFQLTGPVVTRLREFAREEETTLFTVMLAAFQVWLHRYTGQTDLVVGTPVANRERPEVQSLLGFFLNTLPIRGRLDGSASFRQVLSQVRESLLVAFSHADLPFEQLVEMAVKERAPGLQPLHQVMFVLLENGLPAFRLDQVEARPLPVETRTSKNDLTLSIEAVDETWDCRLEYATDLFSAETAARMGRHLTELMQSITDDPEKSVSQLNLMPAAERHQILVEWNQTGREYPQDKCVHQLFEEQVERTPGAVAVVFEEQSLTYRELNSRANQLGHHLRSLGVGPDVLVGLCVERSLEMVVALLGIMKAGGAYLPLDASLPTMRLSGMLQAAQVKVLLTQRKLASRLVAGTTRMLLLDQSLDAKNETNPDSGVRPHHLCYVIYTSGSTGVPKGVQVQHRGVVNLVAWHNCAYGLGPGERTTQLANLSFDAAAWELWPALCAGAAVFIAEDITRMSPEKLVGWLIRHRISVCFMPTPLVKGALHEAWPTDGSLRYLLTGGDELAARPMGDLRFQLVNHYGPTEATVLATSGLVAAQGSEFSHPPSIGRPIANVSVYIVDEKLNPVPLGVAGELCIGGDGLARGYLNAPELTAERFIPNPFSLEPGTRLYKTGDLARWLPDGNIEFLGRLDHQVKIRGYRVELGEIEAVLRDCPGVSECVVATREDGLGARRLLAYLVPTDASAAPGVAQLRDYLSRSLPDYMIPAAFVMLEKLPLTPNGKINRKALEKMDGVELSPDTEYMPPRNERERTLVEIWQALLGREPIGVHDNFFDLGGHSLLAIKFISLLRERTGVDLPIRMLFESPTPATLAGRLTIENQTADSGEAAANGAGRLIIQPTTPSAAPSGLTALDDILGKQLDYVKTWKGERSTPESYIVTLNDSGKRQGLFWCLQGYGELVQLAEHLGFDQPVHGMRSGYLIMEYTDENVAAIAAHYAAEMIALQPDGPFLIGGNCQGGTIARAIALRLRELGRTVSLLILMEQGSFPPYEGPVALIFGRDSHFNPYKPDADPEAVFRGSYPTGFTVDLIGGAHGQFFESPNVETLAAALKRRLPEPSAARHPHAPLVS